MKKYKSAFITTIVILAALSAAWFFGAPPEVNHISDIQAVAMVSPIEVYSSSEARTAIDADIVSYTLAESSEEKAIYEEQPHETYEAKAQEESNYTQNESPNLDIAPKLETPENVETAPEEIHLPDIIPEDNQAQDTDYAEAQTPIEPEDTATPDDSFTVTLSVSAHTILYNMHLLHIDKHELVPHDGWIFPPTVVTAYEGESVFNVLQREMRRNRIHMVSRWTPIFNSAYIEAINNLYEFDVGPLSGWMYSVNGWFPNFGSSRYLLSDGDVIEWIYTVDLGRDLGVTWVQGE